jgi:hypothetical protein
MTWQQIVLVAYDMSIFVPEFYCPSGSERKAKAQIPGAQAAYASHYYANAGAIGLDKDGNNYQYNVPMTGQSGGPVPTNGVIYVNSTTGFETITDGSSNTFLWGELSWNDYRGSVEWSRGGTPYGTIAGGDINVILESAKGIGEKWDINIHKKIATSPTINEQFNGSPDGSYNINFDIHLLL